MASAEATPVVQNHVPAAFHLSDFDDDDAFDVQDDNLKSMPYVFSPDAIREEMARNMPEVAEESWGDDEDTSSAGGFSQFNRDGDTNTSVSTLDIGANEDHNSNRSTSLSPELPLESSLSSNFTQISLTTPADDHPPDELPLPAETESSHNTNGDAGAYVQVVRASARPPSLDLTPRPPLPTSPFDYGYSPSMSTLSTPPSTSQSFRTPLSAEISVPSPAHSSGSHTPSSSTEQAVTSMSLPAMSGIPVAAAAASTLLTEKPLGHRANRSVGPSAFEKVRSKTRPTFLPPKSRQEDDKHMADWQQMMKQSRLAGG